MSLINFLVREFKADKKFNYFLFMRSPLLVYMFYLVFRYNILVALIIERWFMFVYKIIRAYFTDNYNKKKEKY